MVKFNTPEDDNTLIIGQYLGMLLCGLSTGLICGLLGLGLGLIFLNVLPAIGLGIVGLAIGIAYGLIGGARVIKQQEKDKN